MTNLNEHYNKTISIHPFPPKLFEPDDENKIDLCYLTYYGKLTTIIDSFNKIKISQSKRIVSSFVTEEKKKKCSPNSKFFKFSKYFFIFINI